MSVKPGERLVSLDAFRGLTIAGMILVNNPGSWAYVYPPMRHASWHGWTPTDLVFPIFLFIVGVAMTFSLAARRRQGAQPRDLRRKVVSRGLIIIAIGLGLNAFPSFDLSALRIFGVLQRIGLVYLAAGLIVLRTDSRGRVLWIAALLLGYWALMELVPVPGYGAGDLGPEGNLAAFLDRLLAEGHLWRAAWDPEGLLSTLPAVATCLLGVLTGQLIRSDRDRQETANLLFVLGWAGILAGQVWGVFFPINKALWTSSYVLFTAGAALEILALCYWLVDIRDLRAWSRPFVAMGRNPLAIFVLSILVVKVMLRLDVPLDGASVSLYAWVYRALFVPLFGAMNGSLAFAAAYLLVWLVVAKILYRRDVIIRV